MRPSRTGLHLTDSTRPHLTRPDRTPWNRIPPPNRNPHAGRDRTAHQIASPDLRLYLSPPNPAPAPHPGPTKYTAPTKYTGDTLRFVFFASVTRPFLAQSSFNPYAVWPLELADGALELTERWNWRTVVCAAYCHTSEIPMLPVSPRSLCLTVVGRERGGGTSSTQIVVRARE